MKTVPVRELQKTIKECVDHAQKACVVVTRHGRPAAVLIGVEGKDWEHLVTHTAPELAKHISAKPLMRSSKPRREKGAKPSKPAEFFQSVRRFIPGL